MNIMEAQLIIKIIVVLAVIALILHKKMISLLENKLSLKLSNSTYYRIIIISTACIVFFVAFNKYQKDIAPYENTNADNNYYTVSSAYSTAKQIVKEHLKAPKTAEFAEMSDAEAKYKINEDGSVLIRSYVDAENSFGAKIRTHFQCTVKNGSVSELTTW